MPYIQRNADGQIASVSKDKPTGESEVVSPGDPELLKFVEHLTETDLPPDEFSLSSDLQMVRVIEDLIDILIKKQVIVLTDLPIPVQNKLIKQRVKREHMLGNLGIISETDKSIF